MRLTSFAIATLAAGLGTFTVAQIKRRQAPATTPARTSDRPAWPKVAALAARSCARFVPLAASRTLRLRLDRLGQAYRIDQGGAYAVFRETVSRADPPVHPAVLVVGFRLRGIRDWPWPHWLFQRLCILTSPFWSGFRGFRVKLWMVDPATRNYLGIYDWEGAAPARTYLAALTRVLRPLSVPGSVFATLIPDQALETYLQPRAVAGTGRIPGQSVNRRSRRREPGAAGGIRPSPPGARAW